MPTVIGNTERLAFELAPVTPSWELRYSPEAAAWAGLAIWLGGRNLCSHVMPGSSQVQPHLHVPLGPLADWLVRSFPALEFQERASLFPTGDSPHRDVQRWGEAQPPVGLDLDDWLAAREMWWSRHFLRAGAEGALLPDVGLVRDDERLVCTWTAPRFSSAGSPVMVWPEGRFELDWFEARSTLTELVSVVAKSFEEQGIDDAFAWIGDLDPLAASADDLMTAIELYAARDMPTIAELFGAHDVGESLAALRLQSTARDPAESPICQMLRDLSHGASRELGGLLSELGKRAETPDADRRQRWLGGRAVALDAARAGSSPEEAGQLAAIEIRRYRHADGEPVDPRSMLVEFGVDVTSTTAGGGHDRMVAAAREHGAPVVAILRSPRTATAWGVRFEHARALGHLSLDPLRAAALGAASGPFSSAIKRRRSGAFAAELLLPERALHQASDGRLDGVVAGDRFGALMGRYGVGARTAGFQLWNRGWLSSPSVRDDLIDRHVNAEA